MLRNFFIIAWRNLLKNKAYSAINIFGLATGMAVALLIGLWIWDELSFDHYHPNHGQIAEVMTNQTFNGVRGTGSAVAYPVGIELRSKWTSLFKVVSMCTWNETHILASTGDRKISKAGFAVQPEFPTMLSYKMLEGSRDALKDQSSILLSQSTAIALFGKDDPMGKVVKMDNKTSLKVAGVFEDLPKNTTFNDTYFLWSWDKYVAGADWMKDAKTEWDNHSWQLFVELNPNVSMAQATKAIMDIPTPHINHGNEQIILQPMDNWRLRSDFKEGKVSGGRIQFVWLFGIIGVFVLLLACINFMNLSTARSEKRAKEVGIRKTLGSLRVQLVSQLLSESMLVAIIALVVALLLVQASLPFFNNLADKDMHIPWGNAAFWGMVVGFALFTGLVSGSYPALYLSSFQPIKVLKGTFKVGKLASLPRKVLVVIQFTVSITLIIGTVIVFRQIQYAKDRPLGYTREGLITVEINTPEIYGHYNSLRDDLLATGAVEDMAESNSRPTEVTSNQIGYDWPGKDPTTTPLFGTISVTHDYGKTIGWEVKEGRDFSRNFTTDSGAFILNESAVKLMGIAHPVGTIVKKDGKARPIVGVVRDMVMESPYTPVQPTIFFLDYGWTNDIIVRIKPTMAAREALAKIAAVFLQHNPGSPFEYKFNDDEYARKFSDEQRVGNLASIFAILAIFISCLGLFGLASFVAEQRTKEMGVRKVLGASIFNIWKLLSTEFVVLVIISCVIATPLAWYYLHQWLLKYEYHTDISWWIFVVAALGALLITVATVSYQAIKAALANPVRSLRTE
jgi:ABC-type antimicrobial peptide transport system permease subunit